MAIEDASSETAAELRRVVERWERLDEERKGIADDQKDILNEAKLRGFDGKIIRKVIAIRKKKAEAVTEEQQLLETYCNALGMQYALI